MTFIEKKTNIQRPTTRMNQAGIPATRGRMQKDDEEQKQTQFDTIVKKKRGKNIKISLSILIWKKMKKKK